MDGKQFRIIALLLGFIGAALLALLLVLVFGGDDESPEASPAEPTPAPSQAPSGTTPGSAVTVPVT